MDDAILDVDLPAFERGSTTTRKAVVDAVMQSLRTGFVYTRHDLPRDVVDEAYAMLDAFFALPADVKAGAGAEGSRGQRGYTGLLVETAADSDDPDWKEMLNWGAPVPLGHPLRERYPHRYGTNVLPDDLVPGITQVLEALHSSLLDLQRRFLRIVALGIGCHESFFDTMLTDGATLSRAIHYPPMQMAPDARHLWAAAHGDINLTTALPRATARGLQVLTDGGWVDAAPPDDHVIVNTGMMLEHLTNGAIPTGVHRVVADADHAGDRLSVVQFCHPTPWTILAPVPSCISPDNPQRYAPISAADRLDEVLWQINLLDAEPPDS
jgi:isopenicillin N synthase-like dioxygenase